jgi:hypothetical protein
MEGEMITAILGAQDLEMELIRRLVRRAGGRVLFAADSFGRRVRPETAYSAVRAVSPDGLDPLTLVRDGLVLIVECGAAEHCTDAAWLALGDAPAVVRCDHHRPGDPGYGRPPQEYLPASSIGQVIAALAAVPGAVSRALDLPDGGDHLPLCRVPEPVRYAAAADHCLAAAYRGECPGVDPDGLMRWRAESRAAFQRRSVAAMLANVEAARRALRAAPEIELAPGIVVRDLRGQQVAELPEASAREGLCFVADMPLPDGRVKVVCQSGTPDQIAAFMRCWAPAQGLSGIYGDPARGFAGGYLHV